KIERAISFLEKEEDSSAMYCSRLKIVDEQLRLLKYSLIPRRGVSFENSLIQNVATGCTMVLNQKAVQVLQKEFPKHAVMHDWWIYQVISAVGKVVYDKESYIL